MGEGGDEGGDRLGGTGAGRGGEDELAARADRLDDRLLGGVEVEDPQLQLGVGGLGGLREGLTQPGDGRLVPGEGGDEVDLGEPLGLTADVGDHVGLAVGVGPENQPRGDGEAGEVGAEATEGGIHGVGVEATRGALERREGGEGGGVDGDARDRAQVVDEHGVNLDGRPKVEVEVVLGRAGGAQGAGAQQDRGLDDRAGARRVPGGDADGDEPDDQAALVEELGGLGVDRPDGVAGLLEGGGLAD